MARFWLQSLLHNFIFRRCTVPSRVASLRRASQPKTRTQCRSSVRAQSLWNIPAATQKSISLPERVYLKGIGNGIGPYSASHREAVASLPAFLLAASRRTSSPARIVGAGLPGLILAGGGLSAGGDGGGRSPELPAQFYTQRFWFRLSQCHRGVLFSHSQYKLGGKALHTIRKTRRCPHTNLAESPKCGLS